MSTPQDSLNINFSEELHPYRKFVDLREEKGDLVKIGDNRWLALGYDTVMEILRNRNFVSMDPVDNAVNQALSGRNKFLQMVMKPLTKFVLNRHKFLSMVKLWLVMNDPPTHTRLRKISQNAFTPKAIDSLTPVIRRVTNELLDEMAKKDTADLMADFALPLPIAMIAAIIGVPNEGADQFNQWSQDILKGFDQNPDSYDTVKIAMEAQEEVKEFLTRIIRERENDLQDDVISLMIEARDSGDEDLHMTDDEMIANIILLLIAGHETTVNLIGNTMFAFFQHPSQFDKVKEDPELLENVIEEALRYDTPISLIVRVADNDITLADQELKKGDEITLMLYAANNDERKFSNPFNFDIERDNAKRHLSFGMGIHYCLGAPLARAEAKIAFGEIIKRFPGIELVGEPKERTHSFGFNGFKELKVKLR